MNPQQDKKYISSTKKTKTNSNKSNDDIKALTKTEVKKDYKNLKNKNTIQRAQSKRAIKMLH